MTIRIDRKRKLVPNCAYRGLTLVETVISMIIVGGSLIAAVTTLGAAARARQVRSEKGITEALAYDLMNEILTATYEESPIAAEQTITRFDGSTVNLVQPAILPAPNFGPESGEADGTRQNFDDVDDYDGWNSSGTPQAKDGTPLAGFGGWTRSVTVLYANPADGVGVGKSNDTGLKRIEVTVKDPQIRQTKIQAIRSRVGANDQSPIIRQNRIGWVGIELELLGSSAPVYAGSASVNQTPS